MGKIDNLKRKNHRIHLVYNGLFQIISDPDGILTHDLQNRNLTFYTAELRSLFACAKVTNYSNYKKNTFIQITRIEKK